MIIVAMWMLSGSTSESGAHDMMAAVLLRGLGLGFLFRSIALIAFSNLNSRNLMSGIGLFNTGRQLGGLMGIAGLQTLIDHSVVANVAVLGANVTAGVPAVGERLTMTTAVLAAKGMDAAAASQAATSLLGRVVIGQSTVIAFDTAFNGIALLFVIAAPVLVATKIGLRRYATVRPHLSTAKRCKLQVQAPQCPHHAVPPAGERTVSANALQAPCHAVALVLARFGMLAGNPEILAWRSVKRTQSRGSFTRLSP